MTPMKKQKAPRDPAGWPKATVQVHLAEDLWVVNDLKFC